MRFDPEVIEGVKRRAMNGVEFDDAEVTEALAEVAGYLSLYGDGSCGSLVERAAGLELRARNPLPPRPLTRWQSFWSRLTGDPVRPSSEPA